MLRTDLHWDLSDLHWDLYIEHIIKGGQRLSFRGGRNTEIKFRISKIGRRETCR